MSTVKETGAGRPGAPGLKAAQEPDSKEDLKSLPVPEVEKRLSSWPDGLSQAEAVKRLTRYGPNEIAEKKDNPLLKLLTYFWGPIPWMIEAAVTLSGVLRHWPGSRCDRGEGQSIRSLDQRAWACGAAAQWAE